MMKSSVKMKPTSVIKARLGIQKGGPAHAFFTETCYRYMDRFTPYRSGGNETHLKELVEVDTDSITYKSPYAHYQYIGILYVDPETGSSYAKKGATKVPTSRRLVHHTPGTGAYWDKKMWTSRGKEVVEEVQKYVDRGCK